MSGNGIGISDRFAPELPMSRLHGPQGRPIFNESSIRIQGSLPDCGLGREIAISNSSRRYSVRALTFNLTPGCYKFAPGVSCPVADHHVSG